ncbi:MAG: translation factor [Zetaproteobacteria bacterium CG06_land_8_20_14_3_00_59_53]|nr:MAG: translation factor [Zetaproteobacteria bacterium CG23_combo_of_CG06-09_8_20_14_all_59_86]PIQ65102.1 MAG: translation factor [Zetaproteobacteria bacterium CG11_big_fil_rev_8_21_14_0_20_59_439]PIU70146.1 MAG: translation factor [Zetaproteobacteria bacterium CG06_land_8_20_14_3_00_59_53]PIU96117.1 MAG: translation factor [Zetaproteobacteria bacterium CG03_land_8_20_14_0_80_59_51]PIY44905.1 MAG: translation factor [Zetaproteobacteria bacterium CG_4_10_14_0_8_um_filter_59_127]PJC17945.1 MAG
MQCLRMARLLNAGGLIAHHTGTLPGIASRPDRPDAIRRLRRFKQRSGPFLLLADSQTTALGLCTRLPAGLRRHMRKLWPGPATFIVASAGAAAGGMSPACFSGRNVAVRVDADAACRYLAGLCGGWLVSSSLNRRSDAARQPHRGLRMRWHRHLSGSLNAVTGKSSASGSASCLLKWQGSKLHVLRGALPA